MVIGISGKLRTGKNVVADYLIARYGFKQVAFADVLKKLAMEFFDLSYEECYKDKTVRSRDVLQKIGVKWREIDEDVWCRYVLKRIPEGQDTVISDVRFPNEAHLIREYHGKLIRLSRQVNAEYGMDHISETALDEYQDFDAQIENNGTLEMLYQRVDQAMEGFRSRVSI